MKTFKLKSLEIVGNGDGDIEQTEIPLADGLIINREDAQNRWIIEALTDCSYLSFFKGLKEQNDTVVVQVKITKENNPPAALVTSVIMVNEMDEHMNVLLMGTIVDRQKGIIKHMLQRLVEEGYQGESLIKKFKELI